MRDSSNSYRDEWWRVGQDHARIQARYRSRASKVPSLDVRVSSNAIVVHERSLITKSERGRRRENAATDTFIQCVALEHSAVRWIFAGIARLTTTSVPKKKKEKNNCVYIYIHTYIYIYIYIYKYYKKRKSRDTIWERRIASLSRRHGAMALEEIKKVALRHVRILSNA